MSPPSRPLPARERPPLPVTSNQPLRDAMAAARLDIEGVAAELGVDPKTVQRWLAGRTPRPRHRWALASLLHAQDEALWPGASASLTGAAARPYGADAEVSRVFASQADAEDEIRLLASNASEIDLRILRGLGLIALNGSLLRPAVVAARQVRLRVLLLDPDTEAAKRRADEIGEPLEVFTAGSHLVQARLRELDQRPGVDLEIRTYQEMPVWRTIRIDETILVSSFDQEWEGRESPMLMPTPGGMLHRGFRRGFEVAWQAAQPWSK